MQNLNDAYYESLIERYRDKYLNSYSKSQKQANDKSYAREQFISNDLKEAKSKVYCSSNISEVIQYRNDEKWRKSRSEVYSIAMFCKSRKLDAYDVIDKIAKYEGALKAESEIIKDRRIAIAQQPTSIDLLRASSQFKLRKKVFSRADYIRLVNAFWLLKSLENDTGGTPQNAKQCWRLEKWWASI